MDESVVNVDLTNIDGAAVYTTFIQEAISLSPVNTFSSKNITNDEMNQMFSDVVEQNKGNTVTNNVDIRLYKFH